MKWYLLFTYTEAQQYQNGIAEFQEMFVTKTQTQQAGSLGPSSHNTFLLLLFFAFL